MEAAQNEIALLLLKVLVEDKQSSQEQAADVIKAGQVDDDSRRFARSCERIRQSV